MAEQNTPRGSDVPDVPVVDVPEGAEAAPVPGTPADVADTAAPADVPAPHKVPHSPGGAQAPAVPVAETHPSRWGRVADDGTVYVRTADGERAVGVWQAGSPEEGLMHYARRFDDLRTEVELLESRLASGAGDPKQALSSATHLRDGLAEAAVVGDLDALRARLDQVVTHAEKALEHSRQERERARAEAIARKQALVEEAEEIAATSTQWKAAGDRLKAILEEWKTIKGVDRKTDDELWKRFSKARESFSRRRGSHFAELDKQRAAAKRRKEELIEQAEALSDSTDWGPTASRYKELMAEWKAAGRAPKDADDALWQRFRAAQDAFFSRRAAAFSERDAEFAENATRKEELLVEAEKIDPSSNLDAAKAQFRRIQEMWDEIGKVPRDRIRELDGRLKAVADRIRSAEDARWRRTDPEAEARAAQFRERVEQFEAQAAKARAAGDERRAKQAEAQAAQWREWLRTAEEAVANR
ncbi:DUF349 domain-containing protein [Saccharomonospora azurea]|uniref:DUF349 domain-containing protein n=1 Tax=Saccharomonospora azurea TaxID=40988 RepID=UPI002409BAAC|nr:DUF349 domain-containing protein [Saccharomonospora azurea]